MGGKLNFLDILIAHHDSSVQGVEREREKNVQSCSRAQMRDKFVSTLRLR